MGRRRQRRKKRRLRPFYKCMVKTAMACLKRRPGATRRQIERKVMNIYKKRGIDGSKHPKSVKRAISSLMKTRCLRKQGARYQIVPECARDALTVHKRRKSRSRSKSGSQSRSRSRSGSHGHHKLCPRQQKRLRRRKPCPRQRCPATSKICQMNVCPKVSPTSPYASNPIYRFPLRDAMIIAMTIFFSYGMQRIASRM